MANGDAGDIYAAGLARERDESILRSVFNEGNQFDDDEQKEHYANEKNRLLYEQLLLDPNYKDVYYDADSGGVKATHIGHNSIGSPEIFFEGLNGADLERECQDELVRMGHSAIFRDESTKDRYGNPTCQLDLVLDGDIMDIASVTRDNVTFRNIINRKNNQLGRFNKNNDEIRCHTLCMYFHEPSFYSSEKIIKGMKAIIKGQHGKGFARNHIVRIVCVIKGEKDIIVIDNLKENRR